MHPLVRESCNPKHFVRRRKEGKKERRKEGKGKGQEKGKREREINAEEKGRSQK